MPVSQSNDTSDSAPPRVFVQKSKETPFIPGRRSFLKWRDLGIAEASNGFMRAEIISKVPGEQTGTGWHFHPEPCIGQFFFILAGWNELEFEDGSFHRLEAGDCGFIPKGMKHCQLRMSEDFEAMEISFPASIGTQECERPIPERTPAA